MNGQELQAIADTHASGLAKVTVEHRTCPNWDTYKVSGKVFMLMTDMPGHPVVVVKADPEEAVLLRAQYEEISTGYHMDKKHWITAAGGPAIDSGLVKGLITDSYQLVLEKLSKSMRPESRSHEATA